MESLPRLLVIAGLVLVGVGLVLHFLPSLPWLGRLPGDFRIERPGFRLYFPLATSLVISLVLSLVLWLFTRNR